MSKLGDMLRRRQSQVESILQQLWESVRDDLMFIVVATVWTLVRAMGATIKSGENGLKFSFGRATRVLDPGFHPLIPFLQFVRTVPTRSRTLDLPEQKVVNSEGLVYLVDANLVYRVVDVRKALIEIDDLVKGMTQVLGLGVQELLRETTRESIQDTKALGAQLARILAQRLDMWGVEVERAGFANIAPSPRTLRITQFEQITRRRLHGLELLQQGDLGGRLAMGALGSRARFFPRGEGLRSMEFHHRRAGDLRRLLRQRGWSMDRIRAAERRLLPGGGMAENSLESTTRRERQESSSSKRNEARGSASQRARTAAVRRRAWPS